jgi:hypothetical protein
MTQQMSPATVAHLCSSDVRNRSQRPGNHAQYGHSARQVSLLQNALIP